MSVAIYSCSRICLPCLSDLAKPGPNIVVHFLMMCIIGLAYLDQHIRFAATPLTFSLAIAWMCAIPTLKLMAIAQSSYQTTNFDIYSSVKISPFRSFGKFEYWARRPAVAKCSTLKYTNLT